MKQLSSPVAIWAHWGRGKYTGSDIFIVAIAVTVAFLVIYPLTWLFYGSLYSAAPFESGHLTLVNYVRAYRDPLVWTTLANTFVFAFGQATLSVGIGTALAWILTRTNTPGRQVFEFLILTLFLLPTILAVVAWSLLIDPQAGLLNVLVAKVLDVTSVPWDVSSMGGMIFVQGLYLAPLAFLIVAPAFLSADAALEEAARMSGATIPKILRHITLPLAWPAIFSAFVLMFIVGVESFEVPQLLGAPEGIYTYTSFIFHSIQVRYPPDYGVGTALAVSLLVLSALLVWLYRAVTRQSARYETIKGKGYRVGAVDLKGWRWVAFMFCAVFFLMTVVLPLLILFMGSLLEYYGRFDSDIFERMSFGNYGRLLEHPALGEGLRNSFVLSVVGGALCVLLAAVVSYVAVKSRTRVGGVLEGMAMMPIAFPATVLGIALLWAYIVTPIPIYGTLWILGIAYVTRYIPIGVRTVSGGMIQVSKELEDASRMSGASWVATFFRIVLPIVRPTLFAAWLMMFMIFFRELSMSILLAGPGNPVISVVMYDYYTSGEMGVLSALALVMMLMVLTVVAVGRKLLGISFSKLRV